MIFQWPGILKFSPVKHNMVVLNVIEAYEHVYDRTNHV